MGSEFLGLKVEPAALMDFSTGVVADSSAHVKTVTDNLGKLGMKVGLSGLPSGAALGTWNGSMLTATMKFVQDINQGIQAVTTGAVSAAAIYQASDGDAQSQMDAVNSAFAPTANDPSLSSQRQEAQEQAEARGEQTQQEIIDQAGTTSITASGATSTPPTAPPSNVCRPSDPNTAEGAQQLVNAHQSDDRQDQEDGGHSEYDEYEAPEGTPEGAPVPGAPELPEQDGDLVAPGPVGGEPSTNVGMA